MELQKDISNLPKLKIPSLFESTSYSVSKIQPKKKVINPLRFTTESSLEGMIKIDEPVVKNDEDKESLRTTSENWLG
jgi:hypothetical protein